MNRNGGGVNPVFVANAIDIPVVDAINSYPQGSGEQHGDLELPQSFGTSATSGEWGEWWNPNDARRPVVYQVLLFWGGPTGIGMAVTTGRIVQ